MKVVLVDIRNKKIYGLYGGRNEKYSDIYNYVMSADYQNCGYKFNNLEDAIKIKRALSGKGNIEPNFEILVIDNEE